MIWYTAQAEEVLAVNQKPTQLFANRLLTWKKKKKKK